MEGLETDAYSTKDKYLNYKITIIYLTASHTHLQMEFARPNTENETENTS